MPQRACWLQRLASRNAGADEVQQASTTRLSGSFGANELFRRLGIEWNSHEADAGMRSGRFPGQASQAKPIDFGGGNHFVLWDAGNHERDVDPRGRREYRLLHAGVSVVLPLHLEGVRQMNGHWNLRTIIPLSLFVGLSALVTPVEGQTPQYTVTDLGALGLDGGGLGWAQSQSQTDTTLPTLGGTPAVNTVNARSTFVAVGSSWARGPSGDSVRHAAVWRWSAGMTDVTVTDIGVLPGAAGGPNEAGPSSDALSMNGVGDVVGYSDSAYEENTGSCQCIANHAFLWNNGVIHDLGTLAGNGYSSLAKAVDDSHEAVGSSQAVSSVDGSLLNRAFLYTNGKLYNLSFYLVNAPNIRLTDASAINCEGSISAVGYDKTLGNNHPHSYLLTRQGAARSCPP